MTRRSPTSTIGLTSKPPRPNNKTHIMLLQQPVLAEQCHDKGPRRRLLRPYPCRSSVACSDSSPQREEPEKHLLRDVELELGVLPVFFVLPCRGYSIASQGCIAIKRFHKLAYRWQIRKADRRHLAYVWQFIPERPQLEGTQLPPNRVCHKNELPQISEIRPDERQNLPYIRPPVRNLIQADQQTTITLPLIWCINSTSPTLDLVYN